MNLDDKNDKNKKTDGDNQWTKTNPSDDDRERRDGPGGN